MNNDIKDDNTSDINKTGDDILDEFHKISQDILKLCQLLDQNDNKDEAIKEFNKIKHKG